MLLQCEWCGSKALGTSMVFPEQVLCEKCESKAFEMDMESNGDWGQRNGVTWKGHLS